MRKPDDRPLNPSFSSGPCPKRPGWSPANLEGALVGRSHRSKPGKARLKYAIDQTRDLLSIPDDYRVGIVPGSDTGAVEMALWNLLGARGVDVLAWESFGSDWVSDVVDALAPDDVRVFDAPYGELPDLSQTSGDRDIVFLWNGTTSGVRVPDAGWISDTREGLTLCDATSAVFAMPLPWEKLDVVTWSWQKVLGGEGAHGMLVLSPRAAERLENWRPPWPLPKLFRLAKKGKVDDALFEGATINTPSMLCVEDYLDALSWTESIGGVEELFRRSASNLDTISAWVGATPWVEFLARDPATRSSTSICLTLGGEWVASLPADERAQVPKRLCA